MSLTRERRLEIERRQPRGKPWRDPYDVAMPLWAALKASADAESASRPFSNNHTRCSVRRSSTKSSLR
jgi:hypothetical protein